MSWTELKGTRKYEDAGVGAVDAIISFQAPVGTARPIRGQTLADVEGSSSTLVGEFVDTLVAEPKIAQVGGAYRDAEDPTQAVITVRFRGRKAGK